LFALAAACGIAAGWNRRYAVTAATTLDHMLDDHWTDDEIDARNHISTLHKITIDTLRKANNFKATLVTVGLIAQLVALAALSFAAIFVSARL
jgi:hypothetical protein